MDLIYGFLYTAFQGVPTIILIICLITGWQLLVSAKNNITKSVFTQKYNTCTLCLVQLEVSKFLPVGQFRPYVAFDNPFY